MFLTVISIKHLNERLDAELKRLSFDIGFSTQE